MRLFFALFTFCLLVGGVLWVVNQQQEFEKQERDLKRQFYNKNNIKHP